MRKLTHLLRYIIRFGFEGLLLFLRMYVFPKEKIVVKNLHNSLDPFYLRNNYADKVTFDQNFVWNQQQWGMFSQHLANLEVKNVIDCGANIGLTTLNFYKLYPNSKIIAVEPSGENFAMLEQNTSSYKNVSLIKAGIWSKKTNLEIADDYNIGYNGLIVKETDKPTDLHAITIQSIIEDYNIEVLDILKIDIEGAEIKVFETEEYKKWLPNVKVILIELHDFMIRGSSANFLKAIAQYDFDIHISGESLFCVNRRYI